ncbi:hypothetical protein EB796_007352 [Bugula neritina]|uniref:Uncharacterized protein n=1 Tax=Bugula neritina TaxID=10212 RepID=A0A7J7K7W1_BUGNE|nr:hypothetical protein EB796_007352 [Bugula neritina]
MHTQIDQVDKNLKRLRKRISNNFYRKNYHDGCWYNCSCYIVVMEIILTQHYDQFVSIITLYVPVQKNT